ncbi:hypothetical protein BT67DRAFT_410561 [Trichocladium antarcticum]|uniref:C2H2-type domain-containing protein n=1 Tax=Trichocladium antarcticum TaxID=1450529 RepID=A0AAN6UCR7_9PEZI|nr:hypothetical protein BT67DRAFT_410561 [Trichocladium antarcticum]
MFECGSCVRAFPSGWRARDQHCNATGHDLPAFECDTCDLYFPNERLRLNHMRYNGHFQDNASSCSSIAGEYECNQCSWSFHTEDDRNKHYIEDHLYCEDCDRNFISLNNIRMHLNSRAHRANSIKCPFCTASYTTATGMTHHLERGACPNAPNLNRDQIYQFVRSKDPNGLISKNTIAWHDERNTTYVASGKSWNGSSYECYFCHREFGKLPSLNQHLASDVHREALYHCFQPSCRLEFKTLAACINHLESESCGAVRFETVQRRIGDIVNSNRMIRF